MWKRVTIPEPSVPKVMLVEDDPQFVYLMQRYASSSGCRLIHVDPFGQVALQAHKERPDLILLDLGSDGENGWHTLQELRADPVTSAIPVFACSASEVAARGWEDRADGCLLKPVMYEDFVAALSTAILRLSPQTTTERVPGI